MKGCCDDNALIPENAWLMVIALIFREDFKITLNEVWRVVKEEP